MVNSTVPAPVAVRVIPSFYRPFGNLPTDMDISNSDQVWATFGASCAGIGFCLITAFVIVVFLCRYMDNMKTKFNQIVVVLMMIGACLTTAMGLISVADAVTQYPDAQSPYGHAFERLSVIGLIAFFLPALYFRPIAARIDEKADAKRTKITLMVVGGSSGIIMAFTVASLCLKKIPFELLVTTMCIEFVGVFLNALVGVWIILGVKRDQREGLDTSDTGLINGEVKRKTTFEFLLRLLFLGLGIGVSLVYVALINVESPWALWLRGGQVSMLLIHLFTIAFFAWCHFLTFLDSCKTAKIVNKVPSVFRFFDQFCHIKLESGNTTGVNERILKSDMGYMPLSNKDTV